MTTHYRHIFSIEKKEEKQLKVSYLIILLLIIFIQNAQEMMIRLSVGNRDVQVKWGENVQINFFRCVCQIISGQKFTVLLLKSIEANEELDGLEITNNS